MNSNLKDWLWSKGGIKAELLISLGRVGMDVQRWGAASSPSLVPEPIASTAGRVGTLPASHCALTVQARDRDRAQTKHRTSVHRRKNQAQYFRHVFTTLSFLNLKCSRTRAFEPRVLVCNSSQCNLIL